MSADTRILTIRKLSQQFCNGELCPEDYYIQLVGALEDCANDEDADLAMEQLASQLVK